MLLSPFQDHRVLSFQIYFQKEANLRKKYTMNKYTGYSDMAKSINVSGKLLKFERRTWF